MSPASSPTSRTSPPHGRIVESDFRPAWWLRNPHLQTLWPKIRMHLGGRRRSSNPGRTELERRRFELSDGDFIDLSIPVGIEGPRVLIVHGLEGGLDSHYAASLVDSLADAGLQPLFMHLRGASGEPNRLARSYHSGATEDLAEVLAELAEDPEGPVQAAIGFSLGGNLLLKYLGECTDPLLGHAIAVSVPFVLRDAMLRLDIGLSRLYRGYLVSRLKASYRNKFEHRPAPLQVDLDRIRDFNTFDDRITAPLNGFAGVFDYYEQASCRRYLRQIQTPTLIIHSADDPFMFASTVPFAHELGPGVTLELARRGGHVGFVAGPWPWHSGSWLETRILEALRGPIKMPG
ncbi:MAG: alpha/beta fold hydrolase [Gammaproteobacteria bacterium]|jgi:predicted alpha/beta-fold hydrolase|nr:alpha/beta fold hydrolase [Gammaproteobacteria bacterium]